MDDGKNIVETITDWEAIPVFGSEEEEARFWKTHGLDRRLMNEALGSGDATESTSITLRIDPRMLSRLKRLARSRYLNYQSMIKQWISERLEQEVKD